MVSDWQRVELPLLTKAYVIMDPDEYDLVMKSAKAADLPSLPRPDAEGNYPAVQYARATIARGIIRDRVEAGLTQRELAKRAGIRPETLSRIETGRHTASVATIEKIDRALKRAKRGKKAPQ